MDKKIRSAAMAVLMAVWAVLALWAWLRPSQEISESERRTLAQFPNITTGSLLSGDFMEDFEDYTLDQFPVRDAFRRIKALFHYNVLNQQDNNDIYITDGYAAKLEYPLNTEAVDHALERFNWVYEKFLKPTSSNIFCSVIPDKGYYLSAKNGYPAMDYEALFQTVSQGMNWAEYIDLTQVLSAEDYYSTDLHWRQEKLLPAAKKLCEAMGVTAAEDYTQTLVERPFFGVYYGQAALPMDADSMYILKNDRLDACKVFNYTTQSYADVYDMEKLTSKDLYDVYLSGPQSLLRIENPSATTNKELIVFRDSFGSAMVPLLVQDYETVTLVDIRYISSQMLNRYIEFNGQDVLFLYSTTVLNNGTTLK